MNEKQFDQVMEEVTTIRKKVSNIANIITFIVILSFLMGACSVFL